MDNQEKVTGQTKCPLCGATEISINPQTGMLTCQFCRHEFQAEAYDKMTDFHSLEGIVIEEGAKDIDENFDPIITYKCKCCGAEIVVNTNETTQARCHWCRNVLSINETIENGAVPDAVLPFSLSKEDAQTQIQQFVSKRQFYAKKIFKDEFTTDNILGVYLPYMLVNVSGHAGMNGVGEHQIRRYRVKTGKDTYTTYYDADQYTVAREFDINIQGLSVESSFERLNYDEHKTNNIINSIMPFDIENCVKWDANYLSGFTSEKRDSNVDQLSFKVQAQCKDIARHAANPTLSFYDRGVRWNNEYFDIKGQQWISAYLPVWLYSYYEQDNDLLHYVAVNARTKETMGSVPLDKAKLFFVSAIITIISLFALWFMMDYQTSALLIAGFVPGIMYYSSIYNQYRNTNARHYHEKETKKELSNMKKIDKYIQRRTRLRSSHIIDQNNHAVRG